MVYGKKLIYTFVTLLLHTRLLCLALPGFAQSQTYHFTSIDTLLKPHWEITLEAWNVYDGKPFIRNGILFPYSSEDFAIDINTGRKLSIREKKTQELFRDLFSDSLLLRDNYDRVSITNLYTGTVTYSMPRKGPAYYGYVSPNIISDDVVFVAKDRNTISAIKLIDEGVIWEFTCQEKICTKPKVIENKVVFCDKNSLYILDKNSGQIINQKKFEGRIVSDIEINEELLYIWVKGEGLYAINQETLATAWNFHNVEYQFGNYRLLFEGDTVFFASWNLFALDKASGEPIWKSSYGDISLVHNIALVKDYILYYDSGSDGEVSFITAAEKNTGERKFYGFTSKSFPPDNADDPRNLAGIEYEEIAFLDNVHEGIIIGVSRDKIYAFKINEQLIHEN